MKTNYYLPRAGFLLAFCLTISLLSAQTTRYVPTHYASIQLAVDAAQEGDTVLVYPGVYYENIQLRGRNIVLTSRYFLNSDPAAVIRQTIIDGSQPAHPDTASCILVWKGETAATVIQGFTIRGGKGTVWLDPAGFGTFREGGGILTEFSSPIIRHNIIRNNTVTPGGAGIVGVGGGGIRSGEGAVRIENNVITHNRAEGYGGGIVLNYCPGAVVQNNIIAFNYGGKNFSGGGFWATGANNNTVNVLKNNTIAYNVSPSPASQYGGKGGGVWVFSITLQAQNNIIWGNTQTSGKQVAQSGGVLDMAYNCVQTGFDGVGILSADPVFRDTTSFVLEAGSQAIDAGNPIDTDHDFSRNGRRAAFPARGNLRCDLGAYGGAQPENPALGSSFLAPVNFTKVANSPAVTTPGDSRSVNWIDVDGDEDQDLFISNGLQQGENNFLYLNNGTGGFTAVTNDPIVLDGKPSDGATWADYDNDGDNDCFVVNWFDVNNLLYKNNGNGTFVQITTGNLVNDKGYSETASWGDYDLDGNLDLYVSNSAGSKRNFLYHNDGNGTFSKIGTGAVVTDAFLSRSVNWTDIDLDGDSDLFVTNEEDQSENLYRNNGGGNFAKVTTGPLVTDGGKTMSSSWGDYDNDGDFDVFLANDQGNDALFQNDGLGNFTKLTNPPLTTSGGNSFGSQWADVDNDADLDLLSPIPSGAAPGRTSCSSTRATARSSGTCWKHPPSTRAGRTVVHLAILTSTATWTSRWPIVTTPPSRIICMKTTPPNRAITGCLSIV
ncbi:MAG: VCBS repeat-containing protein [Lewinellaceae bacterium]|nr:VCBS repeat-containing protein [Lewinellaceae bacterium]